MSLVLDLIFPRRCYGCGRKGSYLCPVCKENLSRLNLRPLPSTSFEGLLSLFRYRGAMVNLIKDLKFAFVTDLIDEITSLCSTEIKNNYPHLLENWRQHHYLLTPIPLHSYRQNWRGFNQSALFAQSLSQKLNLNYGDDFLFRSKNTVPQTSLLQKSLRTSNTLASFSLAGSPPSNIILVDDVYTTGSTLNSAASVFPRSTNMWSLTLAG